MKFCNFDYSGLGILVNFTIFRSLFAIFCLSFDYLSTILLLSLTIISLYFTIF